MEVSNDGAKQIVQMIDKPSQRLVRYSLQMRLSEIDFPRRFQQWLNGLLSLDTPQPSFVRGT
jgi:hypothetical protein